MSQAKITYGDIAVGAKQNFQPQTEDKEGFVNFDQFKKNYYFPNYVNPCEYCFALLDEASAPFPDDAESAKLGLWSKQLADESGNFTTPIVLELTANDLYTSVGISLEFDTFNNIFANNVNIKWYRNEELLSDMDFAPDAALYVCFNKVEYYNKVVITFYSLNVPLNRLRLRQIEYGYGVTFADENIRTTKIIQEINPISSQISINTADFILDIKSNVEYSFQAKQPLSIYFDEKLISTVFIRNAKRKSKSLWNLQGEDYIGLLADIPFYGGIYENKNAVELINEIFNIAKIPFEIEDGFSNEIVSGYIPYTNCRDALMQVVFAIQAVADTSNSDIVKIYALSDEVKQTIPLTRIMQGQSFGEETTVTSVELTAHAYRPITDKYIAYESNISGSGEEIKVEFPEPLHNLTITNGEIIEYGTNYAIIDAHSGCVLQGQKYEHNKLIKAKRNPLVLTTDIDNVIAIQNATLVSQSNVDKVLEKCYNYLVNTETINLKIVDGKHIKYKAKMKYGESQYGLFRYGAGFEQETIYDVPTNVGDLIEAETEYKGIVRGRITRQTFNLNGGIIVKNTEMR